MWFLCNIMKKLLTFMFIFLLGVSFMIYSVSSAVNTNSLTCGNNICEKYEHNFDINGQDTVTIDGEEFNIKYIRRDNVDGFLQTIWNVNGFEGADYEISNNVLNTNNKVRYLSGDFHTSSVSEKDETGSVKMYEQSYCPLDCLTERNDSGVYQHVRLFEISIFEGWNLLPLDVRSDMKCDLVSKGTLCEDDVLVEYVYVPSLGKYINLDNDAVRELTEYELQKVKEYFEDESNGNIVAKWVYIKEGSGNKRITKQHFEGDFDREILNQVKLSDGWNFLIVLPNMVYDKNEDPDTLSLNDFKGSCNIEEAHLFNPPRQNWEKFSLDQRFDDDFINLGFIVKVSEDCALGISSTGTSPPGLPGGNYDLEIVEITGQKTTYSIGENMTLIIKTQDPFGGSAIRSDGWNMQYYTYEGEGSNFQLQEYISSGNFNARYDSGKEYWIVDYWAPSEIGEYSTEFNLYCSQIDSKCKSLEEGRDYLSSRKRIYFEVI